MVIMVVVVMVDGDVNDFLNRLEPVIWYSVYRFPLARSLISFNILY